MAGKGLDEPREGRRWSVEETLSAVVLLFVFFITGYRISWLFAFGGALLIASMVFISRADPEARRWFMDRFRWVIVLLAAIATSVLTNDFRPIGPDFYAVAAQVIPILLLAVIVEPRVLRRPVDRGDLYLGLLVIYLMAAGEYEALRALSAEGQTTAAPTVCAALAGGFAALIAGALGTSSESSEDLPADRT